METLLKQITNKMSQAFEACGLEPSLGQVTVSNRPDLCQYQCNGAMAAAKAMKKAPMLIAEGVVAKLQGEEMFSLCEAVRPGFINISISDSYLAEYVYSMSIQDKFGIAMPEKPETIVVDYGGPNVAKPLHVGHLRPAIIGEAVKRILRYMGHEVIGDAHLGDWGLQIGLIITELKVRKPELPYFDESFDGAYPEEAPFTMSELEEIYPYASAFSKEHPEYKEAARHATLLLQSGHRGYRALWEHIMTVSMNDLKKNYKKLMVEFDLWKKESDAQPYIPDMVEKMKADGHAYISEGALVVDVKEPTDTKEVPPCMILKSDGATLYNTTDLATIVERMKLFAPDHIIYVVDKRQELYFEQIFRCARKTGLVNGDTKLTFLGFGTMNGKDGKALKTRDGGVMRLEMLVGTIADQVYEKMKDRELEESEARRIADQVGLAALKYGDLSNQASKDYIFDMERFASFEGNTGPYILYTMVRIRSILSKLGADAVMPVPSKRAYGAEESALLLALARFADCMERTAAELAPHKLCQYIYEISNVFNGFYHGNKILSESDETKKQEWIGLLSMTLQVLQTGIGLLAFEEPERM